MNLMLLMMSELVTVFVLVRRCVLTDAGYQLSDDGQFVIYVNEYGHSDNDDDDDGCGYDSTSDNTDINVAADTSPLQCCVSAVEDDWDDMKS